MAITIDHKLNIIIVLLVVLLGYAVFTRYSEKYEDPVPAPLECAKCLQRLDDKRACAMIPNYFIPTGCANNADLNAKLLQARDKFGSNLCDNYTDLDLSCSGGKAAPVRGDCIPTTQALYAPNEAGYVVPQTAQCPEGSEVNNLQVSEEQNLQSYDCCPVCYKLA